jgi:hypothetical protein
MMIESLGLQEAWLITREDIINNQHRESVKSYIKFNMYFLNY